MVKKNKHPELKQSDSLDTESLRGERLQKVLAAAGQGSRRSIEQLIIDGRIYVNGDKAKLGDRVTKRDVIAMDSKKNVIKHEQGELVRRVLMYNKPVGEICTRSDPEGRKTVFDKMPRLPNGRWISIGRLDINTAGLLLFTNDGELANHLMHPSSLIEREYVIRVMAPNADEIANAIKVMQKGVLLDGKTSRFTDIVDAGGQGINRWYYVCIMEGRHRAVRRLWESQGFIVSRLKRVRYGNITLPRGLKRGGWSELKTVQFDQLMSAEESEI